MLWSEIKNNDQKNQTIVPSIIVLVALGIIGAAFGFIWNKLNQNSNISQEPSSKSIAASPTATATQRSLAQHTATVLSVALHPNIPLLASGSYDQTVKLWDLNTGKVQRTLNHAGRVNSALFTPNGRYLITGGGDGNITVWNSETGAEEHQFAGRSGRIISLSVNPEGNLIASGGSNGTIRLWDLEKRQESVMLLESGAPVSSLVFSPTNPQELVSADQDGIIPMGYS